MDAVSPFFVVRDLARALEFYRDALGFEVTFDEGSDPFFAVVRRDGVQFLLKSVGVDAMPNRERHADARWDAFVALSLDRRCSCVCLALVVVLASPGFPSGGSSPEGQISRMAWGFCRLSCVGFGSACHPVDLPRAITPRQGGPEAWQRCVLAFGPP